MWVYTVGKYPYNEGETEAREWIGDNKWREVLGKTTWDEVRNTGGSDYKFDNMVIDYSVNIYKSRLTS